MAERRQLTVLFCDLVGSTALSAQLDPEDLRALVQAYHTICAEVLQRFAGHIAQYLGDGLLVYFGYPLAHEDDAARAVRAGLGILTALQQVQPSVEAPPGTPLQVRIGIHTGQVVVGEIGAGGRQEQLALGETPNVAARVQSSAEPDTVVISAGTYRLVHGLFDCQDLGPHDLKGLPAPVSLYRVRGESGIQSRFEVAVAHGLTPLVGRDEEVALLRRHWARAKDGEGQVVLLSGEPGIGKSRLAQVLKERVEEEGAICIEFRCLPHYQNTALYPLIEHLKRVLHFQREDSAATKQEKLRQTLARYRFSQADTLPLLATLLSLPPLDSTPPLPLSPQRQKQKTLEALVAWFLEEAERRPVYCLWEDLHWADPSSLELLTVLLDQVPTARLYLLLTFRPEFVSPWSPRAHLSYLTLSRLGRSQVGQLSANVTGGKPLPPEVVQQIVAKTDGIPLFVEELTKMVVESGVCRKAGERYELTEPLPPLAIPATLHDSLMARLDRLSTVKEVAQLGATLGREFSYELLHTVSPVDEASLQHALAKLVEAEVLYQRGLPPHARYLFKHALIQDAAYQSLLKSTRQHLHRQIAQVLAARFPETTETQPEVLAHHYTEAGLLDHAIPYWQQAGQRASQHSAYREAVGHLTKGVELLSRLPETPQRTERELTLLLALGISLTATKGYAAPEVGTLYRRARELCQHLGDGPQLFLMLHGLWRFHVLRAELHTARELAEQLLRVAQREHDAALLVEAHRALGSTLYPLGEPTLARTHLEQGIALHDPQQHASYISRYGENAGVSCRGHLARVLWYLGYPDQAVRRIQEALTLAQELAHPFNRTFAACFAAILYQCRREGRLARESAEVALTLASEQGFAFFSALATILHGWAFAVQGQSEEGLIQIRQGQAAWQATGAKHERPYWLGLFADVCRQGGQEEEGLAALTEALEMVAASGDCEYEADLYRLKGELTLQQFHVPGSTFQVENPHSALRIPQLEAEAEECFWKAIEVARQQEAKSLELRATVSLARLWQQQGKREEARQMLAEIYGWFTEGFDTTDLQEARTLLQGLA
jgi:predicted ATPase/class 3 adenylate cyclase